MASNTEVREARPTTNGRMAALRSAFLIVTVGLMFGLLIWIGQTGLHAVVSEMRQIVSQNFDGNVRIFEIANRLQKINTTVSDLMTDRAAGRSDLDVPRRLEILTRDVADLYADLASYRAHTTSQSEAQVISESLEALRRYQSGLKWVGSLLEIDFASAVSYLKPFRAIFDQLSQRFDIVIGAAAADARSRTDQAALAANRAVMGFLMVMLAAAVAITAFAWLAGRSQQQLRMDAALLEQRVAARTHELAARSRDLEDSLATLRDAQARLVMQEKMASLGDLVAGMAHEINTPIGVAMISATLLADEGVALRRRFQSNTLRKTDLATFLDQIAEATALLLTNIERATTLIHSFKMIAVDRTTDERRFFDLRTDLDEVLVSLEPVHKAHGHHVTLICPDGIVMDSYPGAIWQIVSTLLTNSVIHAFEPGQVGRLNLTVTTPDPASVTLVYADDGKGIPAECCSRVFEPFYTTRRGCGGIGLGLHIAYNLVTGSLGGHIHVESVIGQGARFIITLPRAAPTTGEPR